MSNFIFGNVEWNDSFRNFVGLPRPFSKVLKKHRVDQKLSAKVPIPWQSAAKNDEVGFLRIIQENEDIVYYKNLCSYCGIKISDSENVIRWKNPNIQNINFDGNFVLSDIHPLHLECMKQTRIYCPGMRQRVEKEFEYGLYLNLKKNAQEERIKIINKNLINLTNIFYFTADWCEPCKKIKPIIQEINKDKTGLKFHMVDADIEQELVQRFKIQSLPTFIIINQGKEIQRLTGSQTKEKLQEFLTFAETGNYEEIIQKDIQS
jgi:thioredoxin 1